MPVAIPFLAPIITAAGAALSRLVFSRLGPWLAAAAVFLGLELATLGVALPSLRSAIEGQLGGLPADLMGWMGVLRVDVYITIVLSAYAAAHVKGAILRRRAAPA